MYNQYFGFRENPFSIAPDPRYLYMSEMHQDALAHLDFGASSEGCIILLTGEIGTGKTTICRCFLERLEPTAEVAVIINPGLTASELLATVCDEFRIETEPGKQSTKYYIDLLNQFLLRSYSENRKTLLVIDEAQNLDKEALEMVRLLTNLETNQHKLLKIFLLGQSELSTVLAGPDLTQVNQRITGRFHLSGLRSAEIGDYIKHRISVAGGGPRPLFDKRAVQRIHRLTKGIPRLINTLCDRSLLGAYAEEKERVDETIVKKAGRELFGAQPSGKNIVIPVKSLVATATLFVLIMAIWVGTTNDLFHLNLDAILAPSSPSTTTTQSTAAEATGGHTSVPEPLQIDQSTAEIPAALPENTVQPAEIETLKSSRPPGQPDKISPLSAPPREAPLSYPPPVESEPLKNSQDTLIARPEPDLSESPEQPPMPAGTRIVIKTIEINE
jgi:general secretion pathway protein A